MKQCPECNQQYQQPYRFCPDDAHLLSLQDPYHLVGKTLADKYRLDALVAIGGMGAVYSAYHQGTDRRVAFKILQPNIATAEEHIITLFEREAKLASQFFHENIALIFDAGRTVDNIAYIAMEWLEGHTLDDDLAKHGRLSLERTADILRQVAAALDAAHAAQIIHRDLKPSNIMLIRPRYSREQVKVVDFGIGKALNKTRRSPVSLLVGTPDYASPEQFRLGEHIDERSDIYSLGVILYQMITGHLPFNASSMQELANLQLTSSPTPLCHLRPDVPVVIERLIGRMLSSDMNERPRVAGNVAGLFRRALETPSDLQTELDKLSEVGTGSAISDQPITIYGKPSAPISGDGRVENLTQKVNRYLLPASAVSEGRFTIDMPAGARILCIQVLQGSPYIWAQADPSRDAEPRRFLLAQTGQPISTDRTLSYVGTFQLDGGAVVNHLFEYHD